MKIDNEPIVIKLSPFEAKNLAQLVGRGVGYYEQALKDKTIDQSIVYQRLETGKELLKQLDNNDYFALEPNEEIEKNIRGFLDTYKNIVQNTGGKIPKILEDSTVSGLMRLIVGDK